MRFFRFYYTTTYTRNYLLPPFWPALLIYNFCLSVLFFVLLLLLVWLRLREKENSLTQFYYRPSGGIPVNNTVMVTGNGTPGGFGSGLQQSPVAQSVTATGAQVTSGSNQPIAAAGGVPAASTPAGGVGGGSDAGLMQPPRNPAPSTHHKKVGVAVVSSVGAIGAGLAVSAGLDGTNSSGGGINSSSSSSPAGSTTRRRGVAAATISSVAAVVAAVAGGGAGPGPPPIVTGNYYR